MRAVVIGASVAGMCAARVLSKHVDKVVIVDRDVCPRGAEHRIGVPQSHHAHALLARGKLELERLFPGFEQAMLAEGAQKFDHSARFAVLREWGWAPAAPSGLDSLWASRPLIESVVRDKLSGVRNVVLRDRTSAIDLRIEPGDRLKVTGVSVRTDAGSEVIDAELVVDASGRGSKAPHWFESAGLPPLDEDVVEAFAGYSSRFYRRPAPDKRPKDWWWDGLWIEGVPPHFARGGVAFPVEGNRWLATAVGFAKDYPPGDERGFTQFVASLASPVLAQALSQCEPLGDVVVNRSTTNRFRHYETWRGKLDGFLAIGDGVCAFNPVYGQGMSAAAASASELERVIRAVGISAQALPAAHFAAQAKFLSGVWSLAAGADFVWPLTTGKRPPGAALMRPYLRLLGESAHSDPEVLRKLIPVFHLLEPPSSVASPLAVGAVLRSTIMRRLRGGLKAPRLERGTMPPAATAAANGAGAL
jgi:2-polyprenyl-6-methoxyphenol hydroxylase-like FAD-dependent oxidoreductase